MNVQTLISNFKEIVTKKYFCFSGRAGRAEFWQYILCVFVINIVLGIIDALIGYRILGGLFSLAMLLPSLGVMARRLHDTGKSALWELLLLIAGIGGLILLLLCIPEGEKEANQYGDPV